MGYQISVSDSSYDTLKYSNHLIEIDASSGLCYMVTYQFSFMVSYSGQFTEICGASRRFKHTALEVTSLMSPSFEGNV